MYARRFLFLLFIISSIIFFLASYQPTLILEWCGSICHHKLSLDYIRLTSMLMSTFSLILLVIVNHFVQKRQLRELERIAKDRLNIENIHAELEALKKRD